MSDKADEAFLKANDALSSLSDKITPDIILSVALLNGFILAFITTGYLGASSISIQSFTFVLFIWQFVIICFFSSKYVNLTTAYLHKFGMCGVLGYAIQWQLFGMYAVSYDTELAKNIQPIIEKEFGIFMFFYFCFIGLKYCFANNLKSSESTNSYKLDP